VKPAAALLLAALLVPPNPLAAQRLTVFTPMATSGVVTGGQDSIRPSAPGAGRLAAGSMLGASIGSLAGWTGGVLLIVATHGSTNNLDDAVSAAAVAVLAGSVGSVVLGGVGSRIGVRAAGGTGGPLGRHVLASLAGWGASLLVLNAFYANSNTDTNAGAELAVLIGTHGLVTALLAPKR